MSAIRRERSAIWPRNGGQFHVNLVALHTDLLVDRVGRQTAALRDARHAHGRQFLAALGSQLRQRLLQRDHFRVLRRVDEQEFLESRLGFTDAGIEIAAARRSRSARGRDHGAAGYILPFDRQLRRQLLAATQQHAFLRTQVLQFRHLDLQVVDVAALLRRQPPDVATLELGQLLLGFREALLLLVDLLLEEVAGGFEARAALLQRALDERVEHDLHDFDRALPVRVPVS